MPDNRLIQFVVRLMGKGDNSQKKSIVPACLPCPLHDGDYIPMKQLYQLDGNLFSPYVQL